MTVGIPALDADAAAQQRFLERRRDQMAGHLKLAHPRLWVQLALGKPLPISTIVNPDFSVRTPSCLFEGHSRLRKAFHSHPTPLAEQSELERIFNLNFSAPLVTVLNPLRPAEKSMALQLLARRSAAKPLLRPGARTTELRRASEHTEQMELMWRHGYRVPCVPRRPLLPSPASLKLPHSTTSKRHHKEQGARPPLFGRREEDCYCSQFTPSDPSDVVIVWKASLRTAAPKDSRRASLHSPLLPSCAASTRSGSAALATASRRSKTRTWR